MAQWYYHALVVDFVVAMVLMTACMALIFALGLSRRHSVKSRIAAAAWLSSCTVPVVLLVIPHFLPVIWHWLGAWSDIASLLVLDVAACLLFWLVFGNRSQLGKWSMYRDLISVGSALLLSVVATRMFIEDFGRWLY